MNGGMTLNVVLKAIITMLQSTILILLIVVAIVTVFTILRYYCRLFYKPDISVRFVSRIVIRQKDRTC